MIAFKHRVYIKDTRPFFTCVYPKHSKLSLLLVPYIIFAVSLTKETSMVICININVRRLLIKDPRPFFILLRIPRI